MVYLVSCTAVCCVTVITLFTKKLGVVRPIFIFIFFFFFFLGGGSGPPEPQWLRPCCKLKIMVIVHTPHTIRQFRTSRTSVSCRKVVVRHPYDSHSLLMWSYGGRKIALGQTHAERLKQRSKQHLRTSRLRCGCTWYMLWAKLGLSKLEVALLFIGWPWGKPPELSLHWFLNKSS